VIVEKGYEMGNQILTLLSDFGFRDVYVGVLKGVIAQINPSLTVIDLTHQVPPQDVAAGSFCLCSAYSYFPTGTVHIAVVDPGVGSHRRAVAIQFAAGFLVGPDNGLFSRVLYQSPAQAAVELTNPDYWRSPQPSTTFHGRDIFASVGAHLASGVPLEALGTAIDPTTLVQLSLPEYRLTDTEVEGYIQYVDHFGNLITNIPGTVVQGKIWWVEAAGSIIPGEQTYSDRLVGNLIALVGSHGWVEIAMNQGNAQARLSLGTGDAVQVMLDSAVSH
jgi:S-adenosylmethionine hydrolase